MLGIQPLAAHVLLVASSPANGESTTTDIKSVTLRFDQAVSEVISLTVEPTGGESLAGSIETPEPNVIALVLDQPIATTGTYVVRYEVLAGDNDVSVGGIVFRRESTSGGFPAVAFVLGVVLILGIGLAVFRWASQNDKAAR